MAEATHEGGSLAGPQIVLAEASNVLRRMELAERLESSEANLARHDLLTLEIELFTFEPLADRAWELRHNLTIYDGWYVALAEALSCPLLTLDQRLARAAGPTCRIITPPPPAGRTRARRHAPITIMFLISPARYFTRKVPWSLRAGTNT